jgi:hypothetical protein
MAAHVFSHARNVLVSLKTERISGVDIRSEYISYSIRAAGERAVGASAEPRFCPV